MELLFFYKPGCPYCRQAEALLTELTAAHPEYRAIPIRRVDETAEAAFAEQFDYWYVPSFWQNGEKLYEANPADGEKAVRAKLEAVLQKALRRC